MRLNLLLYLFLVFSNVFCWAQSPNNENSYMPVIQQSPDVASLLKYQETPISKNSGLSQVNIPIHSISVDGVTIPISLSYHSAGIRVNEIAPRTGQGWNLIAGGSITRTVKHLSDDYEYGYIHSPITVQEVHNKCMGNHPDCIDYMNYRLRNNTLDLEPDIFNYNAPGISGKFVFNQINNPTSPGDIISFPLSDNKIVPVFSSRGEIISWTITDTQGNKFLFSKGNVLKFTKGSTIESDGNLPTFDDYFAPFSPAYTETWDLTKIITVNGEVVNFGYSHSTDCVDCTFSGQAMAKPTQMTGNLKTTYTQTTRDFSQLDQISGSFGVINFNDGSMREDFLAGHSLSEIEVKNKNNILIKKFALKYYYTQGAYPSSYIFGCKESGGLYKPENPQAYAQYTKRMFLEEIEVFGKGEDSHKYKLDYYNNHILPHRNSYAQDFWGYFNGANNQTLLFDNPGRNYFIDRQVNQKYAISGLLEKIHFPEGGHTKFSYEPNEATILASNFMAYRMVPSNEKILEFFTSETPDDEGFDDGREFFKYRKPLILNKRTFDLNQLGLDGLMVGERRVRFNSVISLSKNMNGITICIPTEGPNGEPSLPTYDQCSFQLTIRKTTLDPADYPDESYINLDDLEYDPNFELIQPLDLERNERSIPPGVYVFELRLLNPQRPYHNMSEVFDVDKDLGIINIYYRVAKDNINFSDDYDYVDVPVGGQRIRKIEDFSAENVIAKTREFKYVLEDGTRTSGRILRTPHFYSKVNGVVSETSLPAVPLITTSAGNVSYTRVVEEIVDHTNRIPNQTVISTYRYPEFLPTYTQPMKPFMDDYRYGQEISVEIPLKKLNTLEYTEKWTDQDDPSLPIGVLSPTSNWPYQYGIGGHSFHWQYVDNVVSNGGWSGNTFYKLNNGHTRLSLMEDITYFNDNPTQSVYQKTYYKYDNQQYNQPTEVETILREGEELIKKFYYSYDFGSENYANAMTSLNQISTPLEETSSVFKNNQETLLTSKKTIYKRFGSKYLPHIIKVAKGDHPYEDLFLYSDYDLRGNPTEASAVGDSKTSFIWGYNYQYPVAKLVNLPYGSISQARKTRIKNLSETIPYNEAEMILELDALRAAYPQAQITTYTYEPLLGIRTITDPKGYRMTYEYDEFGRLKYVKDMKGKVLSKNEYHYKNN